MKPLVPLLLLLPANLVLAICFLFGQALYVLKRAAMAVRNPKNPVSSRRAFVVKNADVLTIRVVAGQLLCWVWLTWPDAITKLFAALHLNWQVALPPIPIVALLIGLASDFILDWLATKVPALNNQLPQLQEGPLAPAPVPYVAPWNPDESVPASYLRVYQGKLYTALKANAGVVPGTDPQVWAPQ